jgi:flagellar basal-body rod modification protein FlgD
MPTIYPTSSATAAASADTLFAQQQQTLDQEDFLKLLIAQMSSQDPMNPMSNEDFIAQMAQFSTLQETQTMGSNIAQLRSEQQLLQAYALLGKTVALQADDSTTVSGVVSGVRMTNGAPQIVVDEIAYDLSRVLTITTTGLAGS